MQESKEISAYKKSLHGKIIDAAMTNFRQKGIRAVRMDDVAAELGISKRTLYEVFDNKELLLYEGVVRYHEEHTQLLTEKAVKCKNVMEILIIAYKYKVEELRNTNPQFYADLTKYPRVARFLNQQNQKLRKNTMKFLDRGVNEGYFRDDINSELVSSLLDAMSRYVMMNRLYQQYSFEEIFSSVLLVSIRGICTDKGNAMLEEIL